MSFATEPAAWVKEFERQELPVLARTVVELDRIRKDPERVTTAQVAELVMRDPLMTFKVLHYLQQRRHRSQQVDVTTIAHTIMMIGIEPMLVHFREQTTLQSCLEHDPVALQGALAVISRARHASLYAKDWAVLRHDIEVDEVTTAALLHDLAELLLWWRAPDLATLMHDCVHTYQMRSEAAQRAILGFPMIALQLELAQSWKLPDLLCRLMDERYASSPRSLNVSLALAVARHSARGWNDAALPDDFAAIGRLLGCSPVAARERIVKVAVRAAADWEWYGVPPSAALMPSSGDSPSGR